MPSNKGLNTAKAGKNDEFFTQLTDIEQEQNGVYNYDRTEKFDSKILYGINTKIAAIEKWAVSC